MFQLAARRELVLGAFCLCGCGGPSAPSSPRIEYAFPLALCGFPPERIIDRSAEYLGREGLMRVGESLELELSGTEAARASAVAWQVSPAYRADELSPLVEFRPLGPGRARLVAVKAGAGRGNDYVFAGAVLRQPTGLEEYFSPAACEPDRYVKVDRLRVEP